MARLSSLQRALRLLQHLSGPAGATLEELAEALGVTDKSVRRDLRQLQAAGVALTTKLEAHGKKRVRLAEAGIAPPLKLAFDEALALHLAGPALAAVSGVLEGPARSGLAKIRAQLSEGPVKFVARLAGRAAPREVVESPAERSDHAMKLMEAVADRQTTFLEYQSPRATEPVTYEVYPLGVAYQKGAFYVFAYAPKDKPPKVRTFKLSRVVGVRVEELKFNPPIEFKLEEYLEHSAGVYHDERVVDVSLRFGPDPAVTRHAAEHPLHASQRLTTRSDGLVDAAYRLAPWTEFKARVLSYGRQVVVLEPPALRRAVAEELRAALESYDSGFPAPHVKTGKVRR
jgi:proteasome accessory factor B